MDRRSFLATLGTLGLVSLLAPVLSPAHAAQPLNLSAKDRDVLEKIQSYLNGIDTVQARFLQSSSNGSYAEGDIYIDRPDRMRFEYDPPVPLLIIASGSTMALYDKELKQVSQVPIWETPLWFLFKDKIQLDEKLVLTELTYGSGAVNITIQEEQAEGNLSSVKLTFSEAPIELKRWEVVDAQGVVVQTGLINPTYGVSLNEDLFDLSKLDVYKFQEQQ
ncbi:MAG TPA: outer membrane lipoprotein carrier protein LolA [Kiloniellales bacterium]|nr:outer membrane lipoprotein carrier protein LolA [Kiloniellales bacterium]